MLVLIFIFVGMRRRLYIEDMSGDGAWWVSEGLEVLPDTPGGGWEDSDYYGIALKVGEYRRVLWDPFLYLPGGGNLYKPWALRYSRVDGVY